MAAFYPNSSAEVDVISIPYVQDQKFTSYSESPIIHHGNMMMYLNGPSSNVAFSEVGPGASTSVDIRSMTSRNEMMFIPPTIGGQSNAIEGDAAMHSLPEEMLFTSRGQLGVVDGDRSFHGLSLSLSTQFSNAGLSPLAMAGNSKDWPYDLHGEGQNSTRFGAPNNLQELVSPKDVGYSVNRYEQAANARLIIKSRFVKAAQQLLDEVVNVQDALKQQDQNVKKVEDGPSESKEKSVAASDANDSATASCQELSATERQELQNKLDRLLAMLNEVDRRYKQYYHQMQVMVSSFDLVAGCGAAKPYTTLALKTISRHFRSLRDVISAQIQATRKSLGEKDSGQGGVIPRLRYVDQQLRQQRSLQQFGMMRHAWRPQRGLPENAVTTLRAWLFEHFLNPYPKDSEKIMLARQTGLTRGQVANWFINARVRLWKPMVEEMYKEEFGEAELNMKSSPENASKAAGETSRTFEDRRDELQEAFRSMADSGLSHDESKINVNHHASEMNKLHDNHHSMSNHAFYGHDHNSLMSFQVPEVGSYRVNNQVSLALGLRRIEGDVGPSAENAAGPEANEYSYFGPGNQQHKFGNSHMLDDFVV